MHSITRCLMCGKPNIHDIVEPMDTLWKKGQNRMFSGVNKLHWKSKKLSVNIQGEIVFGIHPVQIALKARKRRFYKLYIKETSDRSGTESFINAAMLAEGLVEKTWVSKYVLDKLADGRPHQGICLDASPLNVPELDPSEDINKSLTQSDMKYPVWVLPYRVKDPQNLGAILRSSYFLGVDHVVLPTYHTCPLNSMASKASSGSMEIMKLSQITQDQDIVLFLQKWKETGGRVLGATLDEHREQIPIEQYQVESPVLLVVGNEEKGLTDSISSLCDTHVYINPDKNTHPMVDSLNVSVASAILLYHLTRNKF